MSPAAIGLYRAHRAGTIRFHRSWMQTRTDGAGVARVKTVDNAADATHVYRTWHALDGGEYAILHTKVAR